MYKRLIADWGILSAPLCTPGTVWNSMELWSQLTMIYCCWVRFTRKRISQLTFERVQVTCATEAANSISLHQAQLCLNIFSKWRLFKRLTLNLLELKPSVLWRNEPFSLWEGGRPICEVRGRFTGDGAWGCEGNTGPQGCCWSPLCYQLKKGDSESQLDHLQLDSWVMMVKGMFDPTRTQWQSLWIVICILYYRGIFASQALPSNCLFSLMIMAKWKWLFSHRTCSLGPRIKNRHAGDSLPSGTQQKVG